MKNFPMKYNDRGVFPVSEIARRGAQAFGHHPALRIRDGGGYRTLDYIELDRQVDAVARWLVGHGLEPGDRVAILGANRPEWAVAYIAVQAAGGVAVPLDRDLAPSAVRHLISSAGARILFSCAASFTGLDDTEPPATLETVICFDPMGREGVVSWERLLREGGALEVELPDRTMDELAAIFYTSGTTGHSKGVMLTQRNQLKDAMLATRVLPIGVGDTLLSVLPLHHTYECTLGLLSALYCGAGVTYARSLKRTELLADIRNTKVTMILGVPLLFEKFQKAMRRGVDKRGLPARALFGLFFRLSTLAEKAGLPALAKPLFRSFRRAAGFGTLRFFISGGGPLDPSTSAFFNRIGITLLQGYGLTETSPMTHYTPPGHVRHHAVGVPFPGISCKIDLPDENGIGEILVRGPVVFRGYFQNEEATREAFTENGWFRTGDLGRIDTDGYLEVTGRKKNLIVTAGGKNVYPEEIEQAITRSPFIAEAIVLPVKRSSGFGEEVGALVFPNYEALDVHFERKDVRPSDRDVLAVIEQEIRRAQANTPDYQRIRHLRLVEEEFQKTSTRKVKRFLYSGEMVTMHGAGKDAA